MRSPKAREGSFQREWSMSERVRTEEISLDLICNHLKKTFCPGWCGSVSWASSCKPKGHRVSSPVRAHAWVAGQAPGWECVRGNRWMWELAGKQWRLQRMAEGGIEIYFRRGNSENLCRLKRRCLKTMKESNAREG